MLTEGLMSCETVEWETPQSLFDYLDKMFHFDLDPCSTDQNAKCVRHFTKEQDGLNLPWGGGLFFAIPLTGGNCRCGCARLIRNRKRARLW